MKTLLRQLRDPRYIGQEGMRSQAADEIERQARRIEALEHLVVEECDPHDIVDEANAMLVQTARDAVARRATEALGDA